MWLLIAGPTAYICDKCVSESAEIVCEKRAERAVKEPVVAAKAPAANGSAELQARLQAALATGKWDEHKIAEHARRHSHPSHLVDVMRVQRALAGYTVNRHVRDAITAALDELAPYVEPAAGLEDAR